MTPMQNILCEANSIAADESAYALRQRAACASDKSRYGCAGELLERRRRHLLSEPGRIITLLLAVLLLQIMGGRLR